MLDQLSTFRVVLRGYEPVEVDRRIEQLCAEVGAGQQRMAELQRQIYVLTTAATEAAENLRRAERAAGTAEVSYADFGGRIAGMLTLAEQEAEQMRAEATAGIDAERAAAVKAMAVARAEIERYAAETRVVVEREAHRVLAEAEQQAQALLADADRQAAVRLAEADALHEQQRATLARSAVEFERDITVRREKAEQELQYRSTTAEQQLIATQRQAGALQAETEQLRVDATREAERVTLESERKAEQIVSAAVVRADRIRAESERELSAATQRRDSIDAQLTNLRHLLATMVG